MIKLKRHILTVSLFIMGMFVLTFIWVVPAFAQGNLTWGKFKGKVGLKYELEFNDNIFSEKTNEQDDIIHHIIPGIELGYENEGRPGNYFFVGYNVDIARYADFSDNDYETHRAFLNLGLKTAAGFYLNASDNFMQTSDPYGSDSLYGEGANTKRLDNSAYVLLGYGFFNRYAVEGFYDNYFINYDLQKDQWQDRTDNTFGANLVYNITPKTGLFLQYRYTGAEYDEQDNGIFDPGAGANWSSNTSQDYTINDFFVGARFKPGGKLSGEVKLGYTSKDYKNDFDIIGNKYVDNTTWSSETLFSWQARQRTKLTFELRRSIEGSPDLVSASYTDTTTGLMWDQQLKHRLSLKVAGRWNNNDYQNEVGGAPDKEFNIYTGWFVFKWDLKKWLSLGVDYEYTSKNATDSVYAGQEYDRNQARLFIEGKY